MTAWPGPTQREPPRGRSEPLAARRGSSSPRVRYTRARPDRKKPLSRPWRTPRRAATAGAGAAAMPGTRAVGPTTAAPSAPRVVAPAATNRASPGVRGTRDGAAEARVRGVAAAAHLLAVPKAAPRRPLVGWRGGQRPRLKQRALGHSHGVGAVESGEHSMAPCWTSTRTDRWRLARRMGRARTFVASKRWFLRCFRRAWWLPRRQVGQAGAA